MNYSGYLIDEYKKLDGGKSDKVIASELPAMTVGNVSQIRTGLRHLTPEQAMTIAERCKMDIGEVLVRLDMEKAKSPAVRAEFEKVLKRLAGAFAAIVLTMSLTLTPSPSEASASA
ncbi:hypothetical protein [Rheinheimera texasensis]|uniref:hypothetical protein n=1 Tax=Rheinheimera texasensis TaxID=306205 RepID=UPI0032B26389